MGAGRPRKHVLEGTRMGKDGHIDVLRLSDHRRPGCVYYDVRCRLCGREWRTQSTSLLNGVACKCIAYDTDAVRARTEHNTLKGYLYMAVTADKYELPIAVADTAAELAEIIGCDPQRIRERVCRKYVAEGRNMISSYTWGDMRFYRIKEAEA